MSSRSRQLYRRIGRGLLSGFVAVCVAFPASAQEGALITGGIRGVVRDSLGMAIVGVQVTMPGSRLVAETDENGKFELAKVPAGMLSMRFRRLGFAPDTIELMVLAGKTVPFDLAMERLALALSPVLIKGRAALTGWREGFYSRRDLGSGHFFTREDIDRRSPSFLTDMFRVLPGVHIQPSNGMIRNQVRFRGARCAPLTWLDGAPLASGEFDIDALSPRSIEAVEVYTGSIVPPRFSVAPGIGSRTCGTIVIWSREGELRPKKRTSTVSPAAEIAQMVDARHIFTAAQVDITARQDSTRPVRPMYPDALHNALISGSVMAEFIVDPLGQVIPETFSVVFTTHPGFTESVRLALTDAVYVPAIRGGFPVHQVVQHEFRFVPDSSRKRR